MIEVTFIGPDNETQIVQAKLGEDLLSVAQAAGQPLEGTCEGQMACSTCHVIVGKDWFDKLPRATEDEEDMLDLAFDLQETSRLGCQLIMTDALDGLVVKLPSGTKNAGG